MVMCQGVRKRKHPLLASCTRCKYSMETSLNLVIRSKLVTRSRVGEMSDQWRMSLYMAPGQSDKSADKQETGG